MNLRSQAISSVKWNAGSQIVRISLYFLTTVILARLLSPADFGLLGMATVFIGLIAVFNDFGLGSAVIQNHDLDQIALSSVFWLSIGVGIVTMLFTILLSPLVANFYDQSALQPLLTVLSVSFLLTAFGQVQFSLLMKELNFKRIAIIESFAGFLGGLIAIGMALLNWGVWSLVVQILVATGTAVIIYWLISDWRPNFVFNRSKIGGVINFSGGLFGFNLVNYFSRNADYLLIGRFLGAGPLGQYTLAYRIMQFPIQNITGVVNRVLFPTLSKIQEKNEKIRSGFIKASKYIAFITFPAMTGILVLAPEIILVFFGSKWIPSIPVIQVLAIIGLIQSLGGLVGSIYTAKGKTNWLLYWGIFSSVVVVICIIIGLRWGIVGVAMGYAFATIILLYPNFQIPFRLIDLHFNEYIFSLRKQIVITITMGIIIFISTAIQRYFRFSDVAILISNITIGVIIYMSLVLRFYRETFEEFYAALFGDNQITRRFFGQSQAE